VDVDDSSKIQSEKFDGQCVVWCYVK